MHGESIEFGASVLRLVRAKFFVTLYIHEDEGLIEYYGSACNETDRRFFQASTPVDLGRKLEGKDYPKKCYGPCGQDKPLSEFVEDVNRSDGKGTICKACMRSGAKAAYHKKGEE